MKRTLALGLMLLLLTGCGNAQPNKETKTVYAMDTVMTLTAYGSDTEAALEAARREIVDLEYRLSTTETATVTAKVAAIEAKISANATPTEIFLLIGHPLS